MAEEFLSGQMARSMKESLAMINDMAMEGSNGKTERFMKDHGIKVNNMELEYLLDMMGKVGRVNG